MSLFLPRIDAQEIHTGTRSRALPATRPRARLGILQLLRLWRARHRHRQELMQMSARDLNPESPCRARQWPLRQERCNTAALAGWRQSLAWFPPLVLI